MIVKPERVRRAEHSIDIFIDGNDPAQAAVEEMFTRAFGKTFTLREALHLSNRWVLRVLPGSLKESRHFEERADGTTPSSQPIE